VEMHHEDYSRPLYVKWLCRPCHMLEHGNLAPQQISAQIEMVRAGRRTKVFHGGTLCSKCYAAPPAKSQRYCSKCHVNAVMASRARTLARKGVE
jgi:hypothetical protein